uniref:Immunoglobulin V-set domain-containing protein n=1 Tax=Nothobranchius furzeri TaxID=105023 RepID=A0A8C6KV10_NOTFU
KVNVKLIFFMYSLIELYSHDLLYGSGVCGSILITQWPPCISSPSNSLAEIHCYQNHTSYQYLYWYRELGGGDIQLIVYLIAGNPNYEEGFKSGFETRVQDQQWTLMILSIQEKDEAVYLCAAMSIASSTTMHAGMLVDIFATLKKNLY